MAVDGIRLADAVRELRAELKEAMAQAEGEELRFTLGPVEVEFALVITREGSGDGKASFKVLGVGFEAGGGAKVGDERAQTVKLTLNPTMMLHGEKREVEISGRAGRALGAGTAG